MRAPNFDLVGELVKAMSEAGSSMFDAVPDLLRAVLEERAWAQRADKAGKPFASFESFATHRRWQGLESSIDDLLNYCRRHPDVQEMIRAEVSPVGGLGRPVKGHNVTFSTDERGNAATYTLRRLKRDNPDLAAQVVAGALSANAAAVKAGFRKATWTAPVDPGQLGQAIHKRFGSAFAQELKKAL